MVNEDKQAVSAQKAQWYNLAMAVSAEAEGGSGLGCLDRLDHQLMNVASSAAQVASDSVSA